MKDLNDFIWIDPYEGGELEQLAYRIERLEALFETSQGQKFLLEKLEFQKGREYET